MMDCYGCETTLYGCEAIHVADVNGTPTVFCHPDCAEEMLSQPDGNYYCEECREECQETVQDFGIGSYEYWGAPGVDVQLAVVSVCCEADVFDNPGFHGSSVAYWDYEQAHQYDGVD